MAQNKAKKKAQKKDASRPAAATGQSKAGPKKPAPDSTPEIFVPPSYDRVLGWMCLGSIVALAFLMTFHTLLDTDIFWHLKTGEIIFSTHKVPTRDIYSFSVAGKEWIDTQWIFQAILYALYRVSGYTGMILFSAVVTALTLLLIAGPAFKPSRYLLVSLISLAGLLAASIRFKLRPEILSFLYLALEIFLLGQFRKGKKWAWYPLPFLLLLWVNSEGLWPIYFVILGAFLGEEILGASIPGISRYLTRSSPLPPRQSALQLLICLAVSVPVAFCNPHGLRGVIFPWVLFREVSSETNVINQTINDVQSPFARLPALDLGFYVAFISLSALFFVYLFFRKIFAPAALLLWAGFLYLSIHALRNVALFAVASAALICLIIAENAGRKLFPARLRERRVLRLRPLGAAVILAGIIVLGVDVTRSNFFIRNGTHARFGIGALETEYPIRGGQFLKSIMTSQGQLADLRIFANTESSAYFIWAGYPQWKEFFDPRLEVYGDKFLANFVDMLYDPLKFNQADLEYNFDAVVLSSFQDLSDLILALYQSPNWALVYMDGFDVIFLKNKPEFASVIAQHRLDFSRPLASPVPPDLTGVWLARERFCRGYLLLRFGHPELAMPELEAASSATPDDPQINYHLGWALNIMQRSSEAIPYLEKVARKEPKSVANQIQLGLAYAMTGETQRGLNIFEALLQKNPYEITACIDRAMTYEMILKDPGAHQAWQKCEDIYNANPTAHQPVKDQIFQGLERTASGIGPR